MPRDLRLLWVTPHLPRRGVAAARERWWALLARLARRHRVTLLCFVDPIDRDAPDDVLPPGLAAVHRVPKRFFAPDDPLAVRPQTVAGAFSDPTLRDAIAARLAADPYDLVQYEYTEMGHLMPPAAIPTILTVHQLFFAAEGPRWRAAGRSPRLGPVLFHRYLRELDFELRAVAAADHVVTMSYEDAARLRRFLPALDVSISPVGVDCQWFAPQAAAPTADLLFVGNFGHAPNVDAVRFLADDVLPRLGRPALLRVIGRDVPPSVEAMARPGAVEVLGAVDDVRPHLAAARIVVAPVRFGTGMRGKVLEALAMGRPLVTTSIGAEGLGAVSGEHLFVADDAGRFAADCRRVLDEPALGARIGAAGRALVAARFDWDRIADAHEVIYERALHAPVRGGRSSVAFPHSPLRGWPGIAAGAAWLGARGLAWHLRRARPA